VSASPEDHELKEQAIAAYEAEYRDLADNWRSLDGKAQGTVAIAGVFIGGALAFVQSLYADGPVCMKLVVGLGVLLLLVSVGFALGVLRIRTVNAPPDGDGVRLLVNNVLAADRAERPARYLGYLEDRLMAWKKAIDEVASANDSKATDLWTAQRFLGASVVTFALLVLLQLFARTT
jgi:hypothetical protein